MPSILNAVHVFSVCVGKIETILKIKKCSHFIEKIGAQQYVIRKDWKLFFIFNYFLIRVKDYEVLESKIHLLMKHGKLAHRFKSKKKRGLNSVFLCIGMV